MIPPGPPGSDHPLLIKGNFKPARTLRLLRAFSILLGMFLVGGLGALLVTYALVVHYQNDMNTMGQETRLLHEDNKALQVRLNRLQSFQNVESAADKMPHLRPAEEMIEITLQGAPVAPGLWILAYEKSMEATRQETGRPP
jgi:hypothetical protein